MTHSSGVQIVYREPVDEFTKVKQNRARQAAFRAAHPDYYKEWKQRVHYPTTKEGRAAWQKANKLRRGELELSNLSPETFLELVREKLRQLRHK